MKKYDYILPLGGFCGVAAQLQSRGLRTAAFPFDWTLMTEPRSITWLTQAFARGFDDFFLRGNLVPMGAGEAVGLAPYRYRDTVSGFSFIHHFHKPVEEGYDDVARTMKRRLERFLACFAPGKSVLMILATPFAFDPGLARDLLAVVRARYRETSVDLHVIQFGVDFADALVDARRFDASLPFTGAQYRRIHGLYDLRRTSYEWSFLDEFDVPSPAPRRAFRNKFLYKLWKKLSSHLRMTGCAVLGISFPVSGASNGRGALHDA